MKKPRQKSLLILLLIMPSSMVFSAGSGGGGMAPAPSPRSETMTPAQMSDKHYASGVRQKEKAWKFEAKAAKAGSEKSRLKNLDKASKAYNKALEEQAMALRANPENYKAANEMGYALRKTGDFEKAVNAYNYALQLNPNFLEAIEYRGEAYLALGFIDKAKEAYMQLFRADRALADQLMGAIDTWLEDETNASTAAEEFATWVGERKDLAEVSQDTASDRGTW
jgi:tetratricopeptide (TPR) repeat protein